MSNLIKKADILTLPAGRILDTFIQEYVFGDFPSRWSNGKQEEIRCHWFEEHPKTCAEDDGGYCCADGLPKYSTDISRAMSIALAPSFKDKCLSTHTEAQKNLGAISTPSRYWATFSTVPFNANYTHKDWVCASTLPLAICHAALLVNL